MELDLEGKRVLITGGSKGIGLACAVAFAQEGAVPALAARSEETLRSGAQMVLERTGIAPHCHAVDLATSKGVGDLVDAVGDVDILVNNAGAIPGGGLDQLDDVRWRDAWQLKLFGYINLTRAFYSRMKARRFGVIANVIGMAGVNPKADYICGGTANAALSAFTKALGGEAPRHGVRVFGVNPGQTQTERTISLARQRAQTTLGDPERWEELMTNLPFGRLLRAEEVASLIVFASSERSAYLSSTVIDLDGGNSFAAPKK